MSAIISLMSVTENGAGGEASLIGNEGLLGLSVFWGVPFTPHTAVVVMAGGAMKTSADSLKSMLELEGGALHDLLLRYTHALVADISQTAACNRLHPLNARLARWLLVSHDRANASEFRLTEDFLAQILGVRRADVAESVAELGSRKLIDYRRGHIGILDRDQLELESCDCYEIIRHSLNNYLHEPPASSRQNPLSVREYADLIGSVPGPIEIDLPDYRREW